ncbi:MAG: biotin transporter BioY [Clostridiales bacterium]|nr:biotin transporter BioY [Clostridiales bacterium]
MNNSKKIHDMVLTAVMTAVLCVLAPLSLPIGPVPISLATLILYFTAYILGIKKSALSVILYLIIGAVGLPVFSSYGSGLAKLFGPTGGYLIGYMPMVVITAAFDKYFKGKPLFNFIGMMISTAVLLIFGTIWLKISADMTWEAALTAGVIPFLVGDFIKIIVALIFAPMLIKRLKAANLM